MTIAIDDPKEDLVIGTLKRFLSLRTLKKTLEKILSLRMNRTLSQRTLMRTLSNIEIIMCSVVKVIEEGVEIKNNIKSIG